MASLLVCDISKLFLCAVGALWLVFGTTTGLVTPTNHSGHCNLKNSTQGIKASCSHLQLTSVPRDFPRDVITLDLSFNNLTLLQNHDFEDVQNLTTLSLEENQITDIQNETFWPLTKLRILILNGNKLQHIAPSLFIKSPHLIKVILNFNELTELPHAALSAIPHLPTIDLYGNNIQSINFEGFSIWQHLSSIVLTGNAIEEINQHDFFPLVNTIVNKISLISNKLQVLPEGLFVHLKATEKLGLDGNHIHSFNVRPFLGMSPVELLSVAGSDVHDLLPCNASANFSELYPVIKTLDLSRNYLTTIPEGAFGGFEHVTILNLRQNKISLLTNNSFSSLLSLIELDISQNKLQQLPKDAFACMPMLQTLNASWNSLMVLSPQAFDNMPSIVSIALSSNLIESSDKTLWTTKTLKWLDLSYNNLRGTSKHFLTGLTQLKELNMSNSQITGFQTDTFNELANLKTLHLANEKKTYLNGVFKYLSGLQFLDLSGAGIKVKTINQFTYTSGLTELRIEAARLMSYHLFDENTNQSLFAGLQSLRRLRLKENILRVMDSRVFRNLTSLYYLDLTSSNVEVLPSGIFSDLTHLAYLYLNNNKLQTLAGDVFYGLMHLNLLSMQNNTLHGLQKDTFAGIPHLKYLYLPGNQIITILPDTFPPNATLTLDLSRNPFACTCSLKWFRQWLADADLNLKHMDQTLCSSASLKGLAKRPILSFNPEDHCGVRITLIVGILLGVASLGMVVVIAIHNRWWIKYKVFLFRLFVCGYEEVIEDMDDNAYQYQLNLMFHTADQWWVDQFMKPAVEERLPQIEQIVYGDDDLHAGMFYVDAVYHAMDNSFKTVLLLSNQSINDTWFMMKLRMALEHVNDTGLDKVVLIFLEDIEDDHLPYLARLFLSKNKPYMLWTEDEDGQELFWAQFEKLMRSNKAINNVIPV